MPTAGQTLDLSAQPPAALGALTHRQIAGADHSFSAVDFDLPLRVIGGSALTAAIQVPKGRPLGEMGQGIPVTYVPARNTIFLSFA